MKKGLAVWNQKSEGKGSAVERGLAKLVQRSGLAFLREVFRGFKRKGEVSLFGSVLVSEREEAKRERICFSSFF